VEEANSALNDTDGFGHDRATVGVRHLKILVKDIKKDERTSLPEDRSPPGRMNHRNWSTRAKKSRIRSLDAKPAQVTTGKLRSPGL
jgi:hypothetical protein